MPLRSTLAARGERDSEIRLLVAEPAFVSPNGHSVRPGGRQVPLTTGALHGCCTMDAANCHGRAIGAQRFGDSAMSDTPHGDGRWPASDGRWYRPGRHRAGLRPHSVPSLVLGQSSPSERPSSLVRRLGAKRWPFVLIPGLIVCVALLLVVASDHTKDKISYSNGYRYGVNMAPQLDYSHISEACGGDRNVPTGDVVDQWQKGCQAGWAYAQRSAGPQSATGPPQSGSSETTPASTGSNSSTTTVPTDSIQDPSPAGTFGSQPTVTVPPGAPPGNLESSDLIVGTGASVERGDSLIVQYVLASYSSGQVVESSWTGQPVAVTLGTGGVFPGWDEGLVGMRVGGRRELIVPPSQGYGDQPPATGIADNDALVFVVDLLSVTAGPGVTGNTGNTGAGNSGNTGTG